MEINRESIKGLELSELYYRKVIQPFLREKFSDCENRIAVGLVGEGSECFGFDDIYSRDHDWGANICLWLTDEDYRRFGDCLRAEMKKLPVQFLGFPVSQIPGRTGVLSISGFFHKYLKKAGSLHTAGEWLSVPEHHLAVASNGRVFTDPAGEFSKIWEDLRLGYPEDIRLKKLAALSLNMGQAGQYNFPRLQRRGDAAAVFLAENEWIKAVISAVYLLNGKYTPFYKWMFFGMRKLAIVGNELAPFLEQIVTDGCDSESIEEVCRILVREYHRQGISSSPETYMAEQGYEIQRHIKNRLLRELDPWVGQIL